MSGTGTSWDNVTTPLAVLKKGQHRGNTMLGLAPPRTAGWRKPARAWCGQIRVRVFFFFFSLLFLGPRGENWLGFMAGGGVCACVAGGMAWANNSLRTFVQKEAGVRLLAKSIVCQHGTIGEFQDSHRLVT